MAEAQKLSNDEIFRRMMGGHTPPPSPLDGEVVDERDAPRLPPELQAEADRINAEIAAGGQGSDRAGDGGVLNTLAQIPEGLRRAYEGVADLPSSVFGLMSKNPLASDKSRGLLAAMSMVSDPKKTKPARQLTDKYIPRAPEPASRAARMTRTGAEWMAPMSWAGKAPNAVSKLTGGLLSRADVAAAAGATGGKELAYSLDGGEGWQTGGEIGMGLLSGLLFGRTPMANIDYNPPPPTDPFTAPPSPVTPDHLRAARVVSQAVEDPDAALKALARTTPDDGVGEIAGSLSQKVQDQGLANLEGFVTKSGDTTAADKLYASRRRGAEQLEREVALTPADPNATGSRYPPEVGEKELQTGLGTLAASNEAKIAAKRAAAEKRALGEEVQANYPQQAHKVLAEEFADEAGGALAQSRAGLTQDTGLVGDQAAVFKSELTDAAKAYHEQNVKPLWNKVDTASQKVTADWVDGIIAGEQRVKLDDGSIRNLEPDEVAELHSRYGGILGRLKGHLTAYPAQIKKVISDLSSKTYEYANAGSASSADAVATSIATKLKERLAKVSPEYDAALTAERKYKELYEPERLRGVMYPQSLKEESVVNTGDWAGAYGGALARQSVESGDPRVIEAAGNSLRSAIARDLRSQAGDGGDISAIYERYRDAANRFPAIKTEMDGLAAAQLRADLAKNNLLESRKQLPRAQHAAEAKRIRSQMEGRTGRLQQRLVDEYRTFLDDPDAFFDEVLNSNSKADRDRLFRMAKASSRSGAGHAFREHLRRRLSTMLTTGRGDDPRGLERLFGAKSDPKTGNKITALARFDNMVPALKESGILVDDEVNKIRAALARGGRNAEMDRMVTKLTTDNRQEAFDNLLASAIATTVSPLVGSKQSLMINGAIRRYVSKELKAARQSPEYMQALTDLLSDPAKYKGLLEEAFKMGGATARKAEGERVIHNIISRRVVLGRAGAQAVNEEE